LPNPRKKDQEPEMNPTESKQREPEAVKTKYRRKKTTEMEFYPFFCCQQSSN
jgi:hypothetical protein